MAKNVPDYADQGTYIQTSFNLDVQKLDQIDINSKDFIELLRRLYNDLIKITEATNNKTTGLYPLTEVVTNDRFFPSTTDSATQQIEGRQVFRKIINFGALPNTATTSIAHGITLYTNLMFVDIYGVAKNPITNSFLPLPFSSPLLTENIKLEVVGANINITTGDNRAAWTETYVVLEFLKN